MTATLVLSKGCYKTHGQWKEAIRMKEKKVMVISEDTQHEDDH
jgi:hypothetical protein